MRRYGNTSSASVWYALGYIEACQGVRAGETVWQVGFGGCPGSRVVCKCQRVCVDSVRMSCAWHPYTEYADVKQKSNAQDLMHSWPVPSISCKTH